jgi:hypothetical protein
LKKGINTEKVSVTLPIELTGRVRSMVSRGEVSSFVAEALEYYLLHLKQRLALERGYGVWKDENHPGLMTSEDSINYVRDLRENDRERLERLGEDSDS